VVLNENYKGGEVKFTNRIDHTNAEIRSDAGSILLFDASMIHQFLSTADDERQYVLSGEVFARLHGQEEQHTGISHCASWLSLPWLRVYLQRSAALRNPGLLKSLLDKLGSFAERFTDLWAPHFYTNLVDKNSEGKQEFIMALDKNPIPWIVDDRQNAKWTQVIKQASADIGINFDPNVVGLEF